MNGKKIGVQSGTTGENWVQTNLKDIRLSSFKTGIDAALDLKNGAIDAVVLDELPATEIVNKNKDLMIIRDPVFTENKEEYAIAVKKGNKELLDSINSTISKIKSNGKYELLISSYMPTDGKINIPVMALSFFGGYALCQLYRHGGPFSFSASRGVVSAYRTQQGELFYSAAYRSADSYAGKRNLLLCCACDCRRTERRLCGHEDQFLCG